MPSYLHPGVYVEEIPSGAKPIEAVGTSTAAFMGYVTKGTIGEPTLIFKWDDYQTEFGGLREIAASAEGSVKGLGDPMGFSVQAFFQNGGTAAYIVRLVETGTADEAYGYISHPTDSTLVVVCTAVNEGTWADSLIVQFTEKDGAPGYYTVEIGRKDEKGEFSAEEKFDNVSLTEGTTGFIEDAINEISKYITVGVDATVTDPTGYRIGKTTSSNLRGEDLDFSSSTVAQRTLTMTLDDDASTTTIELPAADFTGNISALAEKIQQLTRAANGDDFTCVKQTQNNEDVIVLSTGTSSATSRVQVNATGAASTLCLTGAGSEQLTGDQVLAQRIAWTGDSAEAELVDGDDGDEPTITEYNAVYTEFLKYRDINIICLPGQFWASDGSGNAIVSAAISHAMKMKSRMVLVDPPPASEYTTEKAVNSLTLPTSTYTVLYYPWVKVTNPFYDEENNPGAYTTLKIAPSGYAAGMWARIDSRRGVWKAPAGVEASLLGLAGIEFTVEDGEQDQLNHLGVNCLRKMPGYGSVIWGTRTLSTKANPEWRYVPVRRTAILIEQSIYNGIQWAVFEPNNHQLWASLRANIGSFMDGLFRAGAFQGEKASDAYFVRCNLGDTMTQDDIDRGQVIVIVGFAPLKPAEFVIVRIQQKVAQQ
jgi:phage tail sheath protein FI